MYINWGCVLKNFFYYKVGDQQFDIEQCFNFDELQNHLQGLLKCRVLGATSRDSDLVGLGWGPWNYIFNSFPGGADTAHP